MNEHSDICDDMAMIIGLAPIISGGIMLCWVESLREGRMDPGFTIEQLRRLIAKRHIILKILRGPNPEKEIVDWAMRGGKAEVIHLDDFRTGPGRASKLDVSGSSP